MRSKTELPWNTYLRSATEAHGTNTINASVRGSCRSWRKTRSAVARVICRLTFAPPLRGGGMPARAPRSPSTTERFGVVWARAPPSRSSTGSRSAPPRPLHGSRREASSRRRRATERLPELVPEDRVEPNGGLVEDEHVAACRAALWRARRGRADRPRAGRRASSQTGSTPRLRSTRRSAPAERRATAAKYSRFSRVVRSRYTDGAWVTYATRRGGRVRPQPHRDGDFARLDDLDADDRTHERRLAGAVRAEQTGDPPRGDVEREPSRTSLPPRRTRSARTATALAI